MTPGLFVVSLSSIPDTIPGTAVYSGLEDSEMEESRVADFKAFIEAGRVGAFGEDDTASSSSFTVSSEGENDRYLRHLWSTVRYRGPAFYCWKASS